MEFGGVLIIWVLRLDGTEDEGANLSIHVCQEDWGGVGGFACADKVFCYSQYISISSGNLP